MPRTASVWLALTTMVALVLGIVAWTAEHHQAPKWLAVGVGTSLAASVAGNWSIRVANLADQPWPELLLQTSLRLAIPLGVLLGIAFTRREMITELFLIYFLPFQFVTLIADTAGALDRVKRTHNRRYEK